MSKDRTPRQHAALDGYIAWELIEADGRVSQGGEQHNLFLNQGLNLLASFSLSEIADYLCVGTGTAAVDVANTALSAEVARTNSDPNGGSVGATYQSPGVYRLTFQREFGTASANGNLTEWGFAPVNSGALAVRELFRDGAGNPIVITKTGTQKLRLTYYLTVTIGPTALTAAPPFEITNLGMFSGEYLVSRNSEHRQNDYWFFNMVAANRGGLLYCGGMTQYTATNLTYALPSDGASTSFVTTARSAYVQNSFKRKVTASFATTEGNGTWYGISLFADTIANSNTVSFFAWGLRFPAGTTLVKDNLHSLTLDVTELTWGRA